MNPNSYIKWSDLVHVYKSYLEEAQKSVLMQKSRRKPACVTTPLNKQIHLA